MRYLIPLLLTPSAYLAAVEIPDAWQLSFKDAKITSIDPPPAEGKKPDASFGRVEKEEIVWKHKYYKIESFEIDKKHDNKATFKWSDDGTDYVVKVTKVSGGLQCSYTQNREWKQGSHTYSVFENGTFTCKSKE